MLPPGATRGSVGIRGAEAKWRPSPKSRGATEVTWPMTPMRVRLERVPRRRPVGRGSVGWSPGELGSVGLRPGGNSGPAGCRPVVVPGAVPPGGGGSGGRRPPRPGAVRRRLVGRLPSVARVRRGDGRWASPSEAGSEGRRLVELECGEVSAR
jgi:hypothetical protein